MKYLKRFNENSEHSNVENYMFFGNLKSIKRMIDELLEVDEQEIDNIIRNGHDWAENHMSVSKENIQQVYNLIVNNEENTDGLPKTEVETGSGFDDLNVPDVNEA